MVHSNSSQKIKRTSVREEAYMILRDWIVQGILKPGQQLRDKELAEQLGVSRTPIREALLRLEDEGFVETKPSRSTIVSPIQLEGVLNIYSIVWTLEKLAMEQAFDFIEEKHLIEMEAINHEVKKAIDEGNQIVAVQKDDDFHSIYINLSTNDELKRILLGLKQKLIRMELFYFNQVSDVHFSVDEHDQIIQALRNGNLTMVLKVIEKNWKASYYRIQAHSERVKIGEEKNE
ncbi:GntR family transcriptional regulator [Peribacillus simplex]|uniref:HTH-type transcriptional repressor RspR n=1 Tax=Peribacillus simplex TaxID=1478 RepID=A0A9W4KR96_9BACI|nr:GntR family transcriptional regulator [Peribacillus simplex]MDR4926430.1 GntR family transcriptional regulator [Peribacillus simplex]WHX93601.1 GntR family transcriptional regulator [Peribacillus simplex]CAH0168748.1 HTH-type transcriptional repressor RspR [Peribacillus simplex]